MRLNRIRLYKIHALLQGWKTKMLWNSMKKDFRHVGKNGGVYSLPHISGSKHISIGNHYYFGQDVRIEAWDKYQQTEYSPSVEIGDHVVLTDRVYISCVDKVRIGNGVLIGRDVFITDNSHGNLTSAELPIMPKERELSSKGPVTIGDNVWIGRNVTILSGVTIGNGAVIGAHSLVNKDVPDNCFVAGTPGEIKRLLD